MLSLLFPSRVGVDHVAHDSAVVQLVLVALGDFLVVLANLRYPIVVGVLHGVVGPHLAASHDLDEADGDVFSGVDVVVIYAQDVVAVRVHVGVRPEVPPPLGGRDGPLRRAQDRRLVEDSGRGRGVKRRAERPRRRDGV